MNHKPEPGQGALRAGPWRRLLRAAAAALMLWLGVAPAALADLVINYITINGVATTTIPATLPYTVVVNATVTGTSWWRATNFSTYPVAQNYCGPNEQQPDYRSPGTYNWTYTLSYPSASGSQLVVNGTQNPQCNGTFYALTPKVLSSVPSPTTPTNTTGQITYTVSFSEPVRALKLSDFSLVKSAGLLGTVSIAGVTGVSGTGVVFPLSATANANYGTVYTVTVNTGTSGSGTIGINVVDNDTIFSQSATRLGGTGIGNGNFTGTLRTIDRSPPTATIACNSPALCGTANPTTAAQVSWLVTFNEAVTGVSATKFTLSGTGAAGATIASVAPVSGSSTNYLVTANTSISGTLALNLNQNLATLLDTAGNAAVATTALAGNTYTVALQATLNHVRIVHDGNALTCLPETVTYKACANAACTSLFLGTVTIAPTGATNTTWSPTTVNLASGQASATVLRTVLGNFTLGGTVSPAGTPVICQNGATTGDCTLVFANTSCNFDAVEAGKGANTPINTKLSGNAFTLNLLALSSGAIVTGSTLSGTATLMDAAAATTAEPCGTVAVSNGVAFAFGGSAAAGRHSITFTPFLQAVRKARVKIVSGSTTACSSDFFALRPPNFSVSSSNANGDAAGLNAAAATIFKAGSGLFNLTASSVSGTSAVTGYNGVPLINQDRLQSSALYTGAIEGSFTAGSAVGTVWAARGAAFKYSEVGYVRLAPWGVYDDGSFADIDRLKTPAECFSDSNLGSLVDPSNPNTADASNRFGCYFGNNAASPYFGRFIPDHFTMSDNAIVNRSTDTGCAASTFTYMGEEFAPTFTLTAKNATEFTTRNYENTFAKLNVATGMNLRAIDDASPTRVPFATCGASPCVVAGTASGTFGAGVATDIKLPLTALRPVAAVAPYASFKVGVAPLDSDAVALKAADLDLDPVNVSASATNTHRAVGATILRYGRLQIDNTYGSEQLNMTVKMTAQYWAGSGYQTNALDDCSPLSSAYFTMSNDASGPNGVNATNMKMAGNFNDGAVLAGGTGKVVLNKPLPRPTVKGSVTLNGIRTYLPGKGRATFGVYKAGPVIYVRETF
ncbi:MAG: DUF6701 domain-containing protein [Pseudomonadota bacterium]